MQVKIDHEKTSNFFAANSRLKTSVDFRLLFPRANSTLYPSMSLLGLYPESESIARRLESLKRDLFVSRAGIAYRATQAKWTKGEDVVSGAGALKAHGRWHNKQNGATCYTTLSPETALAESLATARYFGLPIDTAFPKTIVTIRYRLTKVIDLCHGSTRQRLRLGIDSIRQTDWRRDNRKRQEALTQAWGRCALRAGAEALLAPSNAHSEGSNLVVFPNNVLPSSVWKIEKEVDWPQ